MRRYKMLILLNISLIRQALHHSALLREPSAKRKHNYGLKICLKPTLAVHKVNKKDFSIPT